MAVVKQPDTTPAETNSGVPACSPRYRIVTLRQTTDGEMMRLKQSFVVLWGAVSLLAATAAAYEDDDTTYGQEYENKYIERKPDSGQKEHSIPLPPYPAAWNLIEVDLGLVNYPYTLLIDEASFAFGEDKVIRYTAVLRANSGAENVIYEGLRCERGMVKGYAFGSDGRLVAMRNPIWRYVRQGGQDRYRYTLLSDFFCPLPSGNVERLLKEKLKRPNPMKSLDDGL